MKGEGREEEKARGGREEGEREGGKESNLEPNVENVLEARSEQDSKCAANELPLTTHLRLVLICFGDFGRVPHSFHRLIVQL